MIEGVLRGGDAERDMIHTRERPRITSPARKKSDDGRRSLFFRQRRAIALEVVLFAYVLELHGVEDPVAAEAAAKVEKKALKRQMLAGG